MKEITENLKRALFNVTYLPSDIVEHIPILTKYSSLCDTVVEFGTDVGNSTIALLAGLPKKMVSVDIVRRYQVYAIEAFAKDNNIDYLFINESSLNVRIEDIDLLFIDSKHTYEHLSSELRIHSQFVNKYIILHDTVVYAYIGCDKEILPKDKGLRPAIDKFLLNNKKWKIKEEFINCNGLMVLEKL